ncbi:MAG: DUF4279 domain-containing protein [Neisseriaceae bacterium]|nr:DUF4279 domain-containing protein [Neisseriaceae bacterium]
MTKMYMDFRLCSEKINFDFSDLIHYGEIEKNNIGDINSLTNNIIQCCYWSCTTTERKSHYLDSDDILKDFYEEIKPNLEKIKERIKKLNLEVYICIVIEKEHEEDTYALTISKEMISFLNEINANLDFDLYLD